MTMEAIAHYFQAAELKWKFKDGFRVPTLDELDEAVDTAIAHLVDEADLTQLEFGRLIVQKNGQAFDVYVQMHEIPIPNV